MVMFVLGIASFVWAGRGLGSLLPACYSSAFGLELTNLLCTGWCYQREGRGRERGVVSVRKMA